MGNGIILQPIKKHHENSKAKWGVSLDLKLSRKKNSSVSNYISSSPVAVCLAKSSAVLLAAGCSTWDAKAVVHRYSST